MSHNCIGQGCACNQREIMEEKCPFCAVEEDGGTVNPEAIYYKCGTIVWPRKGLSRGDCCYERQIANLEALLMEAENLFVLLNNFPLHHAGELLFDLESVQKEAATLLPRIREARK